MSNRLSITEACRILLEPVLDAATMPDIYVSGFITSADEIPTHICFDTSSRTKPVSLFCLYTALDYDDDRLDPANWKFFVLDSAELPEQNITPLEKLPCLFDKASSYICVLEDIKNCWRTFHERQT